jgi:hypothetical protein
MAIFKCVGCFYFRILEGICFAGFTFKWLHFFFLKLSLGHKKSVVSPKNSSHISHSLPRDTTVKPLLPVALIKLTSWKGDLPENSPAVKLLKNFSTFYETRRFITTFVRTFHWSLRPEEDLFSPYQCILSLDLFYYYPFTSSSKWSPSLCVTYICPICIPLLH